MRLLPPLAAALVALLVTASSPVLAQTSAPALDVFAASFFRQFKGPAPGDVAGPPPTGPLGAAPSDPMGVARAFGRRRPAADQPGSSSADGSDPLVRWFAEAYNVDLGRFSRVRQVPKADMPSFGTHYARTRIDAWNLATLSLVLSVEFSMDLFAMDPDWIGLTLAHEAIHAERIGSWKLGSHHLEEAIAWTWTAAMAEKIGRSDLGEMARRELVEYASRLDPDERRTLDREMTRSGVTAIVIPVVTPLASRLL